MKKTSIRVSGNNDPKLKTQNLPTGQAGSKLKTWERHVGYVTLLGRPSAGKSSLVNALIGDKVSIVSSIPQTTRRLIRGIYTDDKYQIIFQDVPGLHSSAHKWNQSINWVTKNSLLDTDVILRTIDGVREKGEEERMIDAIVESSKIPVVTVVTKSDLLSEKERRRFSKSDYGITAGKKVITGLRNYGITDDTNPEIPKSRNSEIPLFVSSITKENFETLIAQLGEKLPKWPLLYPEGDITDQDVHTRCGEIIREKIFQTTYEEVPHDTYVDVESMEDKGKLVKILAYIYCTSDSQKKILIGNHGAKIKEIWSLARGDLQDLFEKKVYLELHVKVDTSWHSKEHVAKKVLGK